MAILSKLVYTLRKSTKILADFFAEIDRLILKLYRNSKAKASFQKENSTGGITVLNFKTYYKFREIKKMWYWQKNKYRSIEQNRNFRNKPLFLWSMGSLQSYQCNSVVKSSPTFSNLCCYN